MANIQITLPDGGVKEFPPGITAREVAQAIGSRRSSDALGTGDRIVCVRGGAWGGQDGERFDDASGDFDAWSCDHQGGDNDERGDERNDEEERSDAAL